MYFIQTDFDRTALIESAVQPGHDTTVNYNIARWQLRRTLIGFAKILSFVLLFGSLGPFLTMSVVVWGYVLFGLLAIGVLATIISFTIWPDIASRQARHKRQD